MRVLFVTPYVPSLIRVRPLNFLKQLSKRHEVTLASLVYGDVSEADEIAGVRDYCEELHLIPVSRIGSFANCLKHLFTPVPLQAAYTFTAEGAQQIARIAGTGDYDVVHVEHIRGAHLVNGVSSAPIVYDSVDCITRLLKQRLDRSAGIAGRALDFEELLKMRSYEARVASSFDRVVITSEQDRKALRHLINRLTRAEDDPGNSDIYRRRMRHLAERLQDERLGLTDGIAVVRNGVDSEYFHPVDSGNTPVDIAFSGKMSYSPNVSAVLGFYNEVLPRIRAARPDVRFKVIGSNPPESVRKLARDPAVEVTGYVPDIRPHLASAKVIVCPLTVGVGIQNKMLEAMAMEKPVVASSVACKGIPDAVDGRNVLRRDGPAETAQAVIHLLDEPEYREVLGGNALSLVRTKYSWEASTQALESVYVEAIEGRIGRVPCAA